MVSKESLDKARELLPCCSISEDNCRAMGKKKQHHIGCPARYHEAVAVEFDLLRERSASPKGRALVLSKGDLLGMDCPLPPEPGYG